MLPLVTLLISAAPATTPGENAELAQLYQEDQKDRTGAALDWSLVGPRDAQRRDRARKIIDAVDAGGPLVAADYFHAAMIFQHGSEISDVQKAHELAVKAVALDPAFKRARWLAAASKDRELMLLHQPQLYGTQFRKERDRWVLYEVDPSVTDDERARWNVPPLAAARKRAEEMNHPAK